METKIFFSGADNSFLLHKIQWQNRSFLLCFLLPFLLLSAAGVNGTETSEIPAGNHLLLSENSRIDSVLATVNGIPVTLGDVILESASAERVIAGIYSGERLYNETIKIRLEVLENIIFRHLVYDQYRKKPFDIPKQEVENLLASLMEGAGISDRKDFEKQAEKSGFSLEDLRNKTREKLAVDILLAQFCDRTVSVTPKQIYEEYGKHPERWSVPAQIRLQMIQLKPEQNAESPEHTAKVQLVKELLKDADLLKFRQVAKEYSDMPADTWDSKTLVDVQSLRPEFLTLVKDKNVGDILGPVSTPEAIYFIRIAELRNAHKKSFSAVSGEIGEMLKNAAIAEKRQQYRKKLQESAVIRYFF